MVITVRFFVFSSCLISLGEVHGKQRRTVLIHFVDHHFEMRVVVFLCFPWLTEVVVNHQLKAGEVRGGDVTAVCICNV